MSGSSPRESFSSDSNHKFPPRDNEETTNNDHPNQPGGTLLMTLPSPPSSSPPISPVSTPGVHPPRAFHLAVASDSEDDDFPAAPGDRSLTPHPYHSNHAFHSHHVSDISPAPSILSFTPASNAVSSLNSLYPPPTSPLPRPSFLPPSSSSSSASESVPNPFDNASGNQELPPPPSPPSNPLLSQFLDDDSSQLVVVPVEALIDRSYRIPPSALFSMILNPTPSHLDLPLHPPNAIVCTPKLESFDFDVIESAVDVSPPSLDDTENIHHEVALSDGRSIGTAPASNFRNPVAFIPSDQLPVTTTQYNEFYHHIPNPIAYHKSRRFLPDGTRPGVKFCPHAENRQVEFSREPHELTTSDEETDSQAPPPPFPLEEGDAIEEFDHPPQLDSDSEDHYNDDDGDEWLLTPNGQQFTQAYRDMISIVGGSELQLYHHTQTHSFDLQHAIENMFDDQPVQPQAHIAPRALQLPFGQSFASFQQAEDDSSPGCLIDDDDDDDDDGGDVVVFSPNPLQNVQNLHPYIPIPKLLEPTESPLGKNIDHDSSTDNLATVLRSNSFTLPSAAISSTVMSSGDEIDNNSSFRRPDLNSKPDSVSSTISEHPQPSDTCLPQQAASVFNILAGDGGSPIPPPTGGVSHALRAMDAMANIPQSILTIPPPPHQQKPSPISPQKPDDVLTKTYCTPESFAAIISAKIETMISPVHLQRQLIQILNQYQFNSVLIATAAAKVCSPDQHRQLMAVLDEYVPSKSPPVVQNNDEFDATFDDCTFDTPLNDCSVLTTNAFLPPQLALPPEPTNITNNDDLTFEAEFEEAEENPTPNPSFFDVDFENDGF